MSDKEKAKGFLHAPNPWVVTIVGIVLTPLVMAIITGAIDFFQDRDIFHTFLSIVTWIWEKIVWFMLMDIKVIHVVEVVVLWIAIAQIRKRWPRAIYVPEVEKRLGFFSYTEDRFNGALKWSWRYAAHSTKDHPEIMELSPHCPNKGCNMPLTLSVSYGECPLCHSIVNRAFSADQYRKYRIYIEDPTKVKTIIKARIQQGNYPGPNKVKEE